MRVWIKLNNNKISREDRFFVRLLSEGPISNILKEKIIFRACECNTLVTIKKKSNEKERTEKKNKDDECAYCCAFRQFFFFHRFKRRAQGARQCLVHHRYKPNQSHIFLDVVVIHK